MICGNCGAENTEGELFCAVCGAVLRPPQSRTRTEVSRIRRRSRFSGDVLLYVGVVLAAMLLIFAVWRFVGSVSQRGSDGARGAISSETAVRTYIEASMNADGVLAASMLPRPVVETVCEKEGFSEESFHSALTELFQKELTTFSEGFPGWTYSIDVLDVDHIPDVDLTHLQAGYKTDYSLSILGAARVELVFSVSCDKGDKSWQEDFTAVKTDHGWFVDIYSLI